MLHRLRVQGFKSLRDVDVELAKLVVVFGPNAAGKSNLLESLVLLSRLVRERTLAEAFDSGIRGYPTEAFSMTAGVGSDEVRELRIEAQMEPVGGARLDYRVGVAVRPQTGELTLTDERLSRANARSSPSIERVDTEQGPKIRIRRKKKQSHPYEEAVGISHTLASNLQYAGSDRFPDFDALRLEVGAWRMVYLDPRVAMRQSQPPREVDDIGERGEYLVPFLHRLRVNPLWQAQFKAVERTVRAVIPNIEGIHTELVPARGEIDLFITQDGMRMPARVVSEGTLRVLALCAMAASPFRTGLLAFEEPENGVHPRRIEVITRLLARASKKRQVVVTTHSPIIVGEIVSMIRAGELPSSDVALLTCASGPEGTRTRVFDTAGALFEEASLRSALVAAEDAAIVQAAIMRGWLDD